MHDLPQREATDQPPPIHAPLSRAQLISLVVPAVSFLFLIGLLLWGVLSTVGHAAPPVVTPLPATAPPTPTVAASGNTLAPPIAATPTAVPVTLASPTLPATETVVAASTSTQVSSPTTTAEVPRTPTNAAPSRTPTVATAAGTDPSRPLLGRRIGLDPGHGPRGDLGAVLVDANTGRLVLSEDELNLDVALRCRTLLQARGAEVVMTRETKDTFTAPWPADTNGDGIKHGEADDLQERIDILNAGHVEVFLSIHANSSANPAKRQGIQAVYCASADCAFPAQNQRVGKLALDQLETHLAAAGDPITARELRNDSWSDVPGEVPGHLFLLGPVELPKHPRAVTMPGAIVESLYVTSPAEAAQLKQNPVRDAIAMAYADALQAFLTTRP